MAGLTVLGPWVGPGEERTAHQLEAELPDDWEIVAGRKLPGPERDDVDLIVIGTNAIFVIDEKSWGPVVVAGDERWLINGQERRSPLNRVTHLARKLAGQFQSIKVYRNRVGRDKPIHGVVVLSNERLQLLRGAHADTDELVFGLAEASKVLKQIDSRRTTELRLARDAIIKVVLDLDGRGAKVTEIDRYRIDEDLPPIGRARCFAATDDLGQKVLLRCYPLTGWTEGDPRDFIEREVRALNHLADLGRAWRVQPPVRDGEREWYVIPVVPPPNGRSLEASMRKADPARPDGVLPPKTALAVAEDAFKGLAEVHGQKLVHRGLSPKRIWLGRQMRVVFSDFYFARMDGQQTVALWLDADGDEAAGFRAPECMSSLTLCTAESDVFSLSLSLSCWLLGMDSDDVDRDVIVSRLSGDGPLAEVLVECLREDPALRPTAAEVAEKLSAIQWNAQPQHEQRQNVFAEGSLVHERYEVDRQLGRGGFATTWLVYDRHRQCRLVLKEFVDGAVAEAARSEFDSAFELRHDNCAGVYDIETEPAPGFLVQQYIPGESLRAKSVTERLSTDVVLSVCLSVLDALEYLHKKSLVHGDVSPGNIVVRDDGSAVLIDFGFANQIGRRAAGGTTAIMAPELLRGEALSARSDLYALAASMILSMLGRLPYQGDPSELGSRGALVEPTPDEVAQWGSRGSAILSALFAAVHPNPGDRIASAIRLTELLRMVPADQDQATNGDLQAANPSLINPTVDSIRRLYRGSAEGNAGNRGLDDEFAAATYVPTLLDTSLLPKVVAGDCSVVLLSGNPGDGKTSFLVKVGERLRELGASVEVEDEAGWKMSWGGHTFSAVFDASESHNELSSDQILRLALEPTDDGASPQYTALIAINDGRLLKFFTDFEHLFPNLALDVQQQVSGSPPSGRVVLIDLKRRALANLERTGLVDDVAATLVSDDRWQLCNACGAAAICPLRRNASALREVGTRTALAELVLTSHLRKKRRATFRDLRSALAWLITGDRSCADIHNLRANDLVAANSGRAALHDLAFDPESVDYMVQEWAEFDPARVAAPGVQRFTRIESADPYSFGAEELASAQRLIFFGEDLARPQDRAEVRAYRYFDEFIVLLNREKLSVAKDRMLLGVSRIAGAAGYSGSNLAVGEVDRVNGWAVLKEVPGDEFSLEVSGEGAEFVESIPDHLSLSHDSGAELRLSLDTAEMILRAADGELLSDLHSDAVRREVDAFAMQLLKQPAGAVRVIDPAGIEDRIYREETALVRETR